MPRKACSYVVLALCLVGIVLGIVLVLVVIKLLVVPLQDKHIPMSKECIIKDISPVAASRNPEQILERGGHELKTEKRSKMENEVLPNKKAKNNKNARLGNAQLNSIDSALDKLHHARHWSKKIGHRQSYWTINDSDKVYADRCFSVRVQFTAEALDQNGELTYIVKEGFLKQPLDGGATSSRLPWTQPHNKSFCCSCYGQTVAINATLTYSGRTISSGQAVQCWDLDTRTANSKTRAINWLLVNAMLWPTLVFVFGFVGLFFAAIHVIKENSEHDVARANVRTPLRRMTNEVCD